ncbi:MAG: hypothetical protein IT425_14310 [Pirellulales bacterium]|nr:hypothetical protein [Pirellulales bacterium]
MSQPESNSSEPRGVLVRREKANIYTVMLVVALVALVIASLVMIIEWSRYGFQWKPPANLGARNGAMTASEIV